MVVFVMTKYDIANPRVEQRVLEYERKQVYPIFHTHFSVSPQFLEERNLGEALEWIVANKQQKIK